MRCEWVRIELHLEGRGWKRVQLPPAAVRETVENRGVADRVGSRLKLLVQRRLLFTSEQTGRQSGDGDWSKCYNRKMHRGVDVLWPGVGGWGTRVYGRS
jgi:hypothetical protein